MKALQDFKAIIDRIAYKDWRFDVSSMNDVFYVQIVFDAEDAETKLVGRQYGRRWFLSPHMTDSEVVSTCLKAVLAAEEHEAREQFTFAGEAIFGPHFDVQHLHELAKQHRNGGAR